jgi:hypothetical protein
MAGADPTRVVARVGAPIAAAGQRSGALAELARSRVQSLVDEARRDVDGGA